MCRVPGLPLRLGTLRDSVERWFGNTRKSTGDVVVAGDVTADGHHILKCPT